MSYRTEFRPKARKAFLGLPRTIRDSIERRLDALSENPRAGDTKALRGHLRGLMRLRVGDYRVLYVINDEARTIEILRVGHRESFYS